MAKELTTLGCSMEEIGDVANKVIQGINEKKGWEGGRRPGHQGPVNASLKFFCIQSCLH